jgi:SAM-dependent methyltransferase
MDIIEALRKVQADFCPEILADTIDQTRRDIFKIGLVAGEGTSLCDVGGGLGAFGPACAALGMRVTVVDDFRDEVNFRVGEAGFAAHKKFGVRVISADASKGIPIDEKFDVMTCFASIEHHHNSPKRMLRSMVDHLVPGGLFVLSAPNAVDIMKRIQTSLGRAKWSAIEEWYDRQEFRGHVREPIVSDLAYIARDLGIADFRILGRNWIWNQSAIIKRPLESIGRVIEYWPSLCTEIFLVGHKSLSTRDSRT